MIKTTMTGGAAEQPRRTYLIGSERCGACGSRDCDGACTDDKGMDSSIMRAAAMGKPWYEGGN